ncbi:MAG TPA: hypothetical protein DCO79_06790 [Spirochaeta sp.]|nr:hypothetical protein [Spirochaeta sp.]
MKKILFTAALIITAAVLWSQDIRISQIDTNALMFRGEIDIYFSLPGADAAKLQTDDFTVSEKELGDLNIISFKNKPNEKEAIDFILLIDNSGSMYEESFNGIRRIEQAETALESFLDQIEKSGDKAAVYTFNTGFQEVAPLGTNIADIRRKLSSISRPDAEQAYTELYNSLTEAASGFSKTAGRRAVIVLSDGENYSIYEHGENIHERWGTKIAKPDEIVRVYHKSGVTLDGINISDDKDLSLEEICSRSGGKFYDVRSTEEISGVYSDIREKIMNEYRIRVEAPPLKNNIGEIELSWKGSSDSRMLMVPMLFGGETDASSAVLLLLLLAAAAAVAVMFIIPFDKPARNPQIQSLDSNQKTILTEGATIIGASRDAHFTLAGSAGVDPEHATIVQDEKSGDFTLVSKRPVRVNNRKVKTRKLKPGDVIRIEGSTIIFDAPDS